MKKIVVLSLIALLVLAFGSQAFAQEKKPEPPKLEFRASGFIDAQGLYWRNVAPATGTATAPSLIYGPPADSYLPYGTITAAVPSSTVVIAPGGTAPPGSTVIRPATPTEPGLALTAPRAAVMGRGHQFNKKNEGWMTRGHLRFDAVYGKEVSGTIFFEMDSTRWGDTGRPAAAGRGETLGRWGGDEAAVEIKNLFFTFAIPGVPVPMQATAGLQPLSVRPKVFVYTDGTGIKLDTRIDPATISLFWFKALEGKDATSDDVDVYGIQASAKIDKITVGGYGFYYNMKTYPVDSSAALAYGVSPSYDANMWWLGVYADGRVGPVDINFDFVYNRGEVEKRRNYAWNPDVEYRGWMTRARVDFPMDKFNFGMIGVYATGADRKKTSATGLPGTTVDSGFGSGINSTKVSGYVVPPFSENFAFGDAIVIQTEWNRAMSGFRTSGPANLHRGAFGGTWMAQAYASVKATPWYKVTIKGMYIGDTTKNGNTIGNARKAGRPRDDKDIGWEIDLINEINIYRNLKWDIGVGYLFAGDALDYVSNAAGTTNKSPKDPYIILTRLTYSF